MTDVLAAIDALDVAVARAGRVVDTGRLSPFARVAGDARKRRGYLGETVVVALAGGTGSGKSSLLNAIAGERVTRTGAIRPTTDTPLAWIPMNPEPGLVRLLDDLEISDRVSGGTERHLAIIDLPDFDSVEEAHRATVEALLPRVDAIVWVLDPQKYSDRLLHREYLARLSGYQSQFLFVLNQVDRLRDSDVDEVVADLERTLGSDGIGRPAIFTMSADPPDGPPRGVDRFADEMERRFEAKRTALAKLAEDVRRAGAGIAEVTGLSGSSTLDFDAHWTTGRERAVDALVDMVAGDDLIAAGVRAGEAVAKRRGSSPLGRAASLFRRSLAGRALGALPEDGGAAEATRRWAGRPGLETALGAISRVVTELSVAAGGSFGARMRSALGPERIETQVRGAVEGALAAAGPVALPRPRRWWTLAGVIQTILILAIAAAAIWLWADPNPFERGEVPWTAVMGGGAIVVSVIVGLLVRRSGRRAGRSAGDAFRSAIRRELASGIERRIGGDLRDALQVRADLVAALAEVDIETRRAAAALS